LRRAALAAVAASVCLLAPFSGAASPAAAARAATIRACGSRSLGPGSPLKGSDAGALCLLAAFARCAPASFTLSDFGVDTIARDVFSVEHTAVGCRVALSQSFRVVPRPATAHTGLCRALRREGSAVLAIGCVGKDLPAEVSLTSVG
jgi:hypothetical protein